MRSNVSIVVVLIEGCFNIAIRQSSPPWATAFLTVFFVRNRLLVVIGFNMDQYILDTIIGLQYPVFYCMRNLMPFFYR